MRARVSLQDIRQADRLDDEDWGKLTMAMGHILEHWKNRLVIDDEGSLTLKNYAPKFDKMLVNMENRPQFSLITFN